MTRSGTGCGRALIQVPLIALWIRASITFMHNLVSGLGYLTSALRLQRGCEQGVGGRRFLRRGAVQWLVHLRAVRQFVAERRPHLQNRVRETELEDVAGDGLVA